MACQNCQKCYTVNGQNYTWIKSPSGAISKVYDLNTKLEVTGAALIALVPDLVAANEVNCTLIAGTTVTFVDNADGSFDITIGGVTTTYTEEAYDLVNNAGTIELVGDKRGLVGGFTFDISTNSNGNKEFNLLLDGVIIKSQPLPIDVELAEVVSVTGQENEVINFITKDDGGNIVNTFTLDLTGFLKSDEIGSADGTVAFNPLTDPENGDVNWDLSVKQRTVTSRQCYDDGGVIWAYCYTRTINLLDNTTIAGSELWVLDEESTLTTPSGTQYTTQPAGTLVACPCECFDCL